MKRLLLILLILTIPLVAQSVSRPKKWPGEAVLPNALQNTMKDYISKWVNPHVIYVFNGIKAGDSLMPGDVVVWYAKMKMVDSLLCDGTGNDTLTLDDSLQTYQWWNLRAKTLNAASACSLWVTGKDTFNLAQYDTIAMNGGAGTLYFSTKHWRKVSLAYISHHAANDSFVVYGVPFMTVDTTVTQADPLVAGVVYEKSLSDSMLKLCIGGVIGTKLTTTVDITPGAFVQTSATGRYGEVCATPAVGKGLGKVLEGAEAAGTYRVFVCPAY